jgi:hypothetical protein
MGARFGFAALGIALAGDLPGALGMGLATDFAGLATLPCAVDG